VSVAGDQLIRMEIVQQSFEQRQVLAGLGGVRPRLVVAARQEQRDRHGADRVVHDRPLALAPGRLERRRRHPLLRQVLLDRERHWTLEACRCEDAALMARLSEPFDDRAQALRHAGRRVADAVVVDQKEAHD
jgi:hypothetical protein